MIRLDERCTTILEKLNETPEKPLSFGILYKATKPTQYRGLRRRLSELKHADLITITGASYCKITDFGREVATTLKPEEEILELTLKS